MAAPLAAAAAPLIAKGKSLLAGLKKARTAKRAASKTKGKRADRRKLSLLRRVFKPLAIMTAVLTLLPFLALGVIAALFVTIFSALLPGTAISSEHANTVIPAHVLTAYQTAAKENCPDGALPWTVLAGVGAVESGHGTFGGRSVNPVDMSIQPDPIFGPLLDGSLAGTRVVAIAGYAGRYGLPDDARYQQALGPMQFLAPTWESVTTRIGFANADPHNFAHAAHVAAAKLCEAVHRHRETLRRPQALTAALLEYNRSQAYVDAVLAKAVAYDATIPLSTLVTVTTSPAAGDFAQSVRLTNTDHYALFALQLIEPTLTALLTDLAAQYNPLTVQLLSFNEARITTHAGLVVHPDSDITAAATAAAALILTNFNPDGYICSPTPPLAQPEPFVVISVLPASHPDAGTDCTDEIRVVVPAAPSQQAFTLTTATTTTIAGSP